ncbi:hypothetical protein BC830DRAFT_1135137 [Chytriomyces sp. MP71]|nr:hypothetical protein BC830DRAFT_1135137 [Chytriomyces sp. MP71]
MEDLNADYDLLEAAHASLKEKLHDPSSVKDSTGLDDKLRNALKEFEELQSELTILKTEVCRLRVTVVRTK